jgi:excisionase family DNA binding protein
MRRPSRIRAVWRPNSSRPVRTCLHHAGAMQLVTTTPEELERLIERAVESALARNAQTESWMSTEQAADYLDTTVYSIRDMIRRQSLPAHRAPGTSRLLLRASEIDAWVRGVRNR